MQKLLEATRPAGLMYAQHRYDGVYHRADWRDRLCRSRSSESAVTLPESSRSPSPDYRSRSRNRRSRWTGILTGAGSFVTLPVLILYGLSPLAINLTSTVALFPGQVTSGLTGRKLVTGAGRLPSWGLFSVSILGGAFGGLLLLKTPSSVFSQLVPWLVLFATSVISYGKRKVVLSIGTCTKLQTRARLQARLRSD